MHQLQPDMIERVRALNPYDPYLSVDPLRSVAVVYASRNQSPDVEFPLLPSDFVDGLLPESGYYYVSAKGILRLIRSASAPHQLDRIMARVGYRGAAAAAVVAQCIQRCIKRGR